MPGILSSRHALPFKFAGIFVFLIEKRIVVNVVFFVANSVDFFKGCAVFLCVLFCKSLGTFFNPGCKLGGMFAIYELLPAFLCALIAIVVVSLLTKAPEQEIVDEFEAVSAEMKQK